MGRGGAFRGARLLSSEDLQLIILSLIHANPSHGYEIIKEIEQKSSGIYKPSPGMIYPALTYLEEAAFTESEAEGSKKLYKITESGKKHVEENKAKIDEILAQLTVYGQRMAYFRDQMEQEEATEAQWAGSPREQQKREWRELKTEFHDIRHELKHVLFSKLSVPLEEKKRVLEILRKAIDDIKKL
jgi:DNA-binding PadR family transcriptional regulator